MQSMTDVAIFSPPAESRVMVAWLFVCLSVSLFNSQAIANSFRDLPVPEVMRLLCFQHADEAIAFLNAYSIDVNSNNEVR